MKMAQILYDVPEGYVRQPGDIDGSYEMLDTEDQLDYLETLAEGGNELAAELLQKLKQRIASEANNSDSV